MGDQCEELRNVKSRTLVIIGTAIAASGIAIGLVLTQVPFGTPPLGTTANWSTGLQCSPGTTLANGFYELQNYSGETVTVTGVRLVGGVGQRMTSAAYLVPIQHTHGEWLLIGLVSPWPPTSSMWKLGRRVPATIAPHQTVNLVYAQTRTSDHPRSAMPQITYTAGGFTYTLTVPFRSVVASKC
jgi:hypothetical protein